MTFQLAADALAWCCDVKQSLLEIEWPEALLEHPGAAEEWGDTDDRYDHTPPKPIPAAADLLMVIATRSNLRVVFKGLRVRMGVHVGLPRMVRDPMTRRVEYIGPVVNAAARITAMTHGGQIVMSSATFDKIKGSDLFKNGTGGQQQDQKERRRVVRLGKFELPDASQGSS
jgi:class 3 adenylate cyclase